MSQGGDSPHIARPSTPTHKLAETAVGVREVAKNIGRARVRCDNPQSVMVVTKVHDHHLIHLTQEMTRWIIDNIKTRDGNCVLVYIDEQIRNHRRFNYTKLAASNPAYKSNIKFWTPRLCSEAPNLIDFVITLGGDGTVLYTSWLFQHIVPPVIPFHLGSLGFLTVFDFSKYKTLLKQVFEQGVRVNLRMRFTCTVFRAERLPDGTTVSVRDRPAASPALRQESLDSLTSHRGSASNVSSTPQLPLSLRRQQQRAEVADDGQSPRPRSNSTPMPRLQKRSSLSQSLLATESESATSSPGSQAAASEAGTPPVPRLPAATNGTHPNVTSSPFLQRPPTSALQEWIPHIEPPVVPLTQAVIQQEEWPISPLSAVFNPIIEQTKRLSMNLEDSAALMEAAAGVANAVQNADQVTGPALDFGKETAVVSPIDEFSEQPPPKAAGPSSGGLPRQTSPKIRRPRSVSTLSNGATSNVTQFAHNGMLITTETFEVLNELVVDRGPSAYMSQLELFGDDRHLTTVQADGLVVSTPTGSTAYSLSAGGSIVHPEVSATLVTPICPHTLSFRPMLLPDSMELKVCVPPSSRNTAWAAFDGRHRTELRQGDFVSITASRYPFPTICLTDQSSDWFNSLIRCLRWNERQRQQPFTHDNAFGSAEAESASDDEVCDGQTPGSDTPATAATGTANNKHSDDEYGCQDAADRCMRNYGRQSQENLAPASVPLQAPLPREKTPDVQCDNLPGEASALCHSVTALRASMSELESNGPGLGIEISDEGGDPDVRSWDVDSIMPLQHRRQHKP
ncbi:hypothetical protein RI367_002685 [Sorochytrium milnesiophthora]